MDSQDSQKRRLSGFSRLVIVLCLILVLAFFSMIKSIAYMVGNFSQENPSAKSDHLTELRIEGPIYDGTATLAAISRISRDTHCKGVLLRVDSPGGAVGASQEIYAALKHLREKGIPVIVSFGNIAASGGYYVSLAGEKIFSNPGTLTGSIGVIFQFPEAEKLLDKIGVSLETVKSGALKDVGSPGRKPTPEELHYLQGVIDDTYAQFLEDVAANRHLSLDSLRPIADGRVLTGRQAVLKGLVDTLGGIDDAKRYLEKRVGVSEDVAWIQEPKPKSRIDQFLEPESESSTLLHLFSEAKEKLNPGPFFLWP